MIDIRFTVRNAVGHVTLDRAAALNALTEAMIIAFDDQLRRWQDDAGVRRVVVTSANARAFCAGGDVRSLHARRAEGADAVARFFRHEYRLNARIRSFAKPIVALVDGIAMGGGLGISVNGHHRVVTEHVTMAMPETAIGFFPDVGATDFLGRCPGRTGLYLALTGARIGPEDACHLGLATAFVPRARLAALADALDDGDGDPGATIALFALPSGPAPIALRRTAIDAAFGAPSLAAAIDRLGARDDDWARETRALLAAASPTSLAVTWAQFAAPPEPDFRAVMRREFRMARQFSARTDFVEGVRAALVDKDRTPRWDPATLDAVTASEVARYFASPPEGELAFD
ncbi:MAG: enoyl-CoA hydratase/isomerase family protein [Alphaproteobacteria bacterium]|nr:enoyl-CoA hydratase/isomerase family protein [Alphaproteobacteria bacterium]